jgi:hypothetical protein
LVLTNQAYDEIALVLLHDHLYGITAIQIIQSLGDLGPFAVNPRQLGIEQAEPDPDFVAEQGKVKLRRRIRLHGSNTLRQCLPLFQSAMPSAATEIYRMTLVVPRSPPESFMKSRLYQAFCAERTEILRHKWIESEKAGRGIGFDVALIDWTVHHHPAWPRAHIDKLKAENMA